VVVADSEEAAAVVWVAEEAEVDSRAVVAHDPPGDSVEVGEAAVVADSQEEPDLRSEAPHR
jgi:hypothetical protein